MQDSKLLYIQKFAAAYSPNSMVNNAANIYPNPQHLMTTTPLISKGLNRIAKNKLLKGSYGLLSKKLLRGATKKIPFVGAAFGLSDAYSYLKHKEYLKSLAQLGATASYQIPGLGTLIGSGIDSALLAHDIYKYR